MAMFVDDLIACTECDVVHRRLVLPPRSTAECSRCGAELYRDGSVRLDRIVAFSVAALILFVLSNIFPVVSLEFGGSRISVTLLGAVTSLAKQGMWPLAVVVFVTIIGAPALQLILSLYIAQVMLRGQSAASLVTPGRILEVISPWSMIEVLMLGILVAYVKLIHYATVLPGVALWSTGALMVLMVAASSELDARRLPSGARSAP